MRHRLHRIVPRLRSRVPLLAAVVGLGVLVALIAIDLAGNIDEIMVAHPLVTGIVQDGAVALLAGGLGFYWLRGRRRALAVRAVHRSLGRTSGVSRRSDLLQLAVEHAQHAGQRDPLILAGPSGAGKRHLLEALAHELVGAEFVALEVPADEIARRGLHEVALETFAATTRPHLRNGDEAAKVWNHLVRHGLAVVLVPRIDRLVWRRSHSTGTTLVAEMLADARRDGLRVVATWQAAARPVVRGAASLWVGPLRRDELRDIAPELTSHWDLVSQDPFLRLPAWAALTTSLEPLGREFLQADPDTRRYRLVAGMVADRVRSRAEGPDSTTMEGLQRLAFSTLFLDTDAPRVREVIDLPGVPSALAALHHIDVLLEVGEQTGLVVRTGDRFTFTHPDLPAFLAAQPCRRDPEAVMRLLARADDPRAMDALVLSCVEGGGRREHAHRVLEIMTEGVGTSGSLREKMPAAALRIAAVVGSPDLALRHVPDRPVVSGRAGTTTGAELVAAIRWSPHPRALESLWTASTDDALPVRTRWRAASAVVARAEASRDEAEQVATWTTQASGQTCRATQEAAAWVLPAIPWPRVDEPRPDVLQRLLEAASDRRRAEMAVSWGLRLAARQGHTGEATRLALHFLSAEPVFWHARLSTAHALMISAMRAGASDPGNVEAEAALETLAVDADEHPLVRATTELALRALRDGHDDWTRWAWISTEETSAQGFQHLHPEARALVGDVVASLNLHAGQSRSAPGIRGLPRCLAAPRRHRQLEQGCDATCPLKGHGTCNGLGPITGIADLDDGALRLLAATHTSATWTRASGWSRRRAWRLLRQRLASQRS